MRACQTNFKVAVVELPRYGIGIGPAVDTSTILYPKLEPAKQLARHSGISSREPRQSSPVSVQSKDFLL